VSALLIAPRWSRMSRRVLAIALVIGAFCAVAASNASASFYNYWYAYGYTWSPQWAMNGSGNFSVQNLTSNYVYFHGYYYSGSTRYKCGGVPNDRYAPNSTGPLCTGVANSTTVQSYHDGPDADGVNMWHPY
jgi:hypothetical protein